MMNNLENPYISPATQATLDCLHLAVSKALERKRRLGHYSVHWSGDKPFAVGDDAPDNLRLAEESVTGAEAKKLD